MNKIFTYGSLFTLSLLPTLTNAQDTTLARNSGLGDALLFIGNLVNLIIPILIAVAVIVLIFNIVKFIINANNDEERSKGAKGIIAGLIGLAVIVSIWGLVNVLQRTFGLDGDTNRLDSREIPTVPIRTQ